jgi:hypothetical protein
MTADAKERESGGGGRRGRRRRWRGAEGSLSCCLTSFGLARNPRSGSQQPLGNHIQVNRRAGPGRGASRPGSGSGAATMGRVELQPRARRVPPSWPVGVEPTQSTDRASQAGPTPSSSTQTRGFKLTGSPRSRSNRRRALLIHAEYAGNRQSSRIPFL